MCHMITADDLAELDSLEQALRAADGEPLDEAAARELYFAVRRVKRRIMFRDPAIDFERAVVHRRSVSAGQ